MPAIEFQTQPHNGTIFIPTLYPEWFETPATVILLATPTLSAPQANQVKQARTFFENMQMDLSDYRFHREEANER